MGRAGQVTGACLTVGGGGQTPQGLNSSPAGHTQASRSKLQIQHRAHGRAGPTRIREEVGILDQASEAGGGPGLEAGVSESCRGYGDRCPQQSCQAIGALPRRAAGRSGPHWFSWVGLMVALCGGF